MKKILSLLSLSLLLVPALVSAATLTSHDTVSISSPLNDDVYAAGNTINIDQTVQGDVIVAGREINTKADISGDVMAAGETITINKPVDDDVRTAGRRIRINTTIGDDLFAAGQEIELSDSTIEGDVYVAGQTIIISGTIKGTVRAAGENVEIKPGTHIGGNLLTYGTNDPVIGNDVVIGGTKKHHKEEPTKETRQSVLMGWLKGVVTYFILGMILLYLFPQFTAAVVAGSRRYLGQAALTSAVWLVLFIPVSLLFIFSGIGFPVGITIILITITFCALATGYRVIILGSLALQWLNKDMVLLSWQHVLLGSVLYQSLVLIPGLGGLVFVILTVITLGSILVTLWRTLRMSIIA